MLEVRDLTVTFSGETGVQTVVDHVSFVLNDSETLAVVGESGSGKTVTALSILKLIPSPPGKITVGQILYRTRDRDVEDLTTLDERGMENIRGKSISMVFQEPMSSLNPVYTCGDQVTEPLRIHLGLSASKARERALELFREVMLPDPERIFRSYPHQLSGGQKQRVMIAMAISCDPDIVIADEPTTALDVTVQKTILILLKKLQVSRKMGILFITHDLGIVSGFADRVVVMSKGVIVEEGTVDKIFRHAEHPYTRGLIACRPPLSERPRRLPIVEGYLSNEGGFGSAQPPAGHGGFGSAQPPEGHGGFGSAQPPEGPGGFGSAQPPEGHGGFGSAQPPEVSREERKEHHKLLYAAEPVLRVERVGKRYGSRTVLNQAEFNVYPGETLGIVGESGSGKTTLARVMLELIPPSEGRILYHDTDITQLGRSELKKMRKDLQIIFQDPYSSLNPRITIGGAILEPMKVHRLHGSDGARRAKAEELLEKVGLKRDHFNRYPHEFSGGQRQRICIARALAVEPRLIICDESVSALDVSIQAQVLNLLNDLKRDLGLTYIFISHDLSVVRYMSDRLIVMQGGRIVEMGEADAVFDHPAMEYTRTLLEAIPDGKGDQVTR